MGRRDDRKLTVLDLMVLVAATAAALGWTLAWGPEPGDLFSKVDRWWKAIFWAAGALYLSLPFAISGTLAVFALRWRRPRPRLAKMACQPGFAACSSALLALAVTKLVTAATVPVDLLASRWRLPPALRESADGWDWRSVADTWERLNRDLHVKVALPGFAILAAWLVLRLGGRWRPERSWGDRAGRTLGLWWVAMILVHLWTLWAMFGFIGESPGELD